MTRKEKLMKMLSVTAEDERAIKSAAQAVWQYIGCDILQAIGDEKGISAEQATISKANVIELVLDADRLSEQLSPRRNRPDPLTPAGRAFLDKSYIGNDRALMHIFMKETFTYNRYGY